MRNVLLINDLPKSHILYFAKFRVSAHSLKMEKGRHKGSCYQKGFVLFVKDYNITT